MQIAYKFSINFNFSKEEVWSDIDFTAKSAENYYEICLINFSLINFDNIDVLGRAQNNFIHLLHILLKF